MSTRIDAATILRFKSYADNVKHGGNGNGYVDGDEIEVFNKKCKTAGLTNVDEVISDYNENRTEKEAYFDSKHAKSNSNVENAVISALSDNTYLRTNDKSIKTATTIKNGIKQADNARHWWNPLSWFNNEEEILNPVLLINSDNVLDIINDDEVVSKIGEADEDDNIRKTAINQVLSSLLQAAQERKIDISNILIDYDGSYLTGRDIKGIQIGTEINDNETLSAVISAARKQIENGKKTVNGDNNNTVGMLEIAAKRIDARDNGNGYIDTVAETEEFKQFAASHGFDVDTILEQIRDNEANGVENTTLAQQTIYNIFDPEQKAAYEKQLANSAKNVSRAFADGLMNDDEKLLTEAATDVSSDSVMQVLNDNPNLVQGLVDQYDYTLMFWKDDSYQNYTTPILSALYDYAKENGIEIDDIVIETSEGKFVTGGAIADAKACSDATDADNVAKVVKALHDRIKKSQV